MKKIFCLLLLFAPLSTFKLQAQEKKELIEVTYGIFLKKVVPNFKEGTFYSEFYWWIKFKNDSTRSKWDNNDIVKIEYVNACQSEPGGSIEEILESKKFGNNEFYYSGYHQGDFYFNPDYSSYPFDIQALTIVIENPVIPSSVLVYKVDTASFIKSGADKKYFGLSNDLLKVRSTNFNISRSAINTSTGIYNSDFGNPEFQSQSTYSRVNVGVFISRSFYPYITKFIIPLAIILFLAYCVFYIPADKIDVAAGLTVTSLLSAIAFQLSMNSDLPEIGYLIYVDKVFYSCYFLIAISMAESLYTFSLDKSGEDRKIKLAERLDLISRVLYPLIFIACVYLFA